VGAKRVDEQGKVFSFGEYIVHPKGFHHVGKGVPGSCYRFPEETDVIAGGVMAVKRALLESLGGAEVVQGELGMVELCLRARREGARCVVVPDVLMRDAGVMKPTSDEARGFAQRWGFAWNAADLDDVRARHAGSGLLWNVRLHGADLGFAKYAERPAMHWKSYEEVAVYKQRADHLVKLAANAARGGHVLDLGCGDGLFTHLFAMAGLDATGVDVEAAGIEQAKEKCAARTYPKRAPRFVHSSGGRLAFADAEFDAVVMLDVIEHLPNPVAVLREVRRVVKADGAAVISTPAWQYGGWSDAVYHISEYTLEELTAQVEAATGMRVVNTAAIGGVYRDVVVVARM
ncbi:MAG TPA: class I SAM-dependent methyltransferase, partial [Phycisphaerales bacterium]|nr:class I SAM-dependent methyltransferase [Phycisphaerales bacterium]